MTAQANSRTLRGKWLLTLLVVSLLIPVCALSQQEPAASPKEAESSSVRQPNVPPAPEPVNPYPITSVGSTRLLTRTQGEVGIGPFYVSSFEFFQVLNNRQFSNFTVGPNPGNQILASVFRSEMGFDHQLRHGRIALQYKPQFGVFNGKFQNDLTNQQLRFDNQLQLTPRLSLSIGQSTLVYGQRGLFADLFFESNPSSGTVLQNPVAVNASLWLYSSSFVSVGYSLSPRMRFTITPRFEYNFVEGNQPVRPDLSEKHTILRAELTRQMTRTRILGFYEDTQWSHFTGGIRNADYQSFGVVYTDSLRPSLIVNATVGAVTLSGVSLKRTWTPEVHLSLIKMFPKVKISTAYARTRGLSGFITSKYLDRYDGSFETRLGRRVLVDFAGGYYQETESIDQVKGYFAQSRIRYAILRHLNGYLLYTHRQQDGHSLQLQEGRQNFVIMGLQWASSPLAY